MLPPARLQALVGQAVRMQMASSSAFDNDPAARVSLWSDRSGSLRALPTHCVQTLREHQAQVWAAQFSSDGKKCVTGGKNGSVCIWDVRSHLDRTKVQA
jgi:WD40 repeat protein